LQHLVRTRNGERHSVRKPFRCTPLFAAALADACSRLFYAALCLTKKNKEGKSREKNHRKKKNEKQKKKMPFACNMIRFTSFTISSLRSLRFVIRSLRSRTLHFISLHSSDVHSLRSQVSATHAREDSFIHFMNACPCFIPCWICFAFTQSKHASKFTALHFTLDYSLRSFNRFTCLSARQKIKNLYFHLMKVFLLSIVLLVSIGSKAQTISADSTKYYLNKQVTVCDEVASTFVSEKGTTFLNFGDGYPNQDFSVVIYQVDANKFNNLSGLKGKSICVSGLIKEYNHKPSLILSDPSQLHVSK